MKFKEVLIGAKSQSDWVRTGCVIYEAQPDKVTWAVNMLQHCVSQAQVSTDTLSEAVNCLNSEKGAARRVFRALRSRVLELEDAKRDKTLDVEYSLCGVAECVMKVVANLRDHDDFDEDSGHWIVHNVFSVAQLIAVDPLEFLSQTLTLADTE